MDRSAKPYVLLIDDDAPGLEALEQMVRAEGFTTRAVSSLQKARATLSGRWPDLVLVDLFLDDGNGIDFVEEIERLGSTQVVLITAHASVDTAVEALQKGATDYLTKPLDVRRLKTVLAGARRAQVLRDEVTALRDELRRLGRFGSMIGGSPAMQRVYDRIGKVAPSNATVLLTGESGTGKELAAQTLHNLSKRRHGPFIAVNCGALSPQIIESELFGHERGSFTGADREHKGLFELASGGTLFLDEVAEMHRDLQVKLLRVLETGTVIRVGGERPTTIDVRIVAATNQAPTQAVAEGRLRHDLLYRLSVFPIEMPPLRERGDDIPLLALHFLEAFNQAEGTHKAFAEGILGRLQALPWEGNVRELKNVVHQMFILASDDTVSLDDIRGPSHGTTEREAPQAKKSTTGLSLDQVIDRHLRQTLLECGGDKRRAAEVLGISLKTLYNRLKTPAA